MELRHLRYFVAVAEELSFTKAAQRLFTAQPSLSLQIRQLEEEIGVILLDRSSKNIKLTPEGTVFLTEAEKILNQVQVAVNTVKQLANTHAQRINIGFLPAAEIQIFPHVIPPFRHIFPNNNLNLVSLTCREQLDKLRQGELDIAFSRHNINNETFTSELLFHDPLFLAVNTDSPLADYDVVPLKKLNNTDLVISDPNFSFELNRITREYLYKHKITIKNFHYSKNILYNVNSIAIGLGHSIVPAYVQSILPKNVILKKTDKALPTIGLYMTYTKNHPSALHNEFVKLVKSLNEKNTERG